MPQTVIQVFQEADGDVPFQEWLEELEEREPIAHEKCLASLLRLESLGYELRRPTADSLRDGIFELRFRVVKVQYRVLYFFFGRNMVVLSHGLTKKSKVPAKQIDKAIERMKLVEGDSTTYIAEWGAE